MATAPAALPFGKANAAACGNSNNTFDVLEGLVKRARVVLVFITALSIGLIVVAIMNLRMGMGNSAQGVPLLDEHGQPVLDGNDDPQIEEPNNTYPNKTRDYLILMASILSFVIGAASSYTTRLK
uniref:Wsv414-like protein n=1 Tax=Pasiphaea japonica whispovirus TaxID=2984286 RepID=A0A9C7C7E9_9VIRU|nr:MAG: wsv414-like protein [Pasiphaea japonica whispovirus]